MTTPNNNPASALEQCREARRLWLVATTQEELDQVEDLYRGALNSKKRPSTTKEPLTKKRKKTAQQHIAELSPQDYRKAAERLSLLYCQSGRTAKAKKGLEIMGFVCRLSHHVLDYRLASSSYRRTTKTPKKNIAPPPCAIYDDFLQTRELQHLESIFADPKANYWSNHNYQVEPPSPYFSYIIPLNKATSYGFIGKLIQKVWTSPDLNKQFSSLKTATMVELWAHNRPHASGHQMHFDSDDEGRGGVIRNPIVSTIIYITADAGGPSLITNQRLSSTDLATKGWLAHAKAQRFVAFDGSVLHGVVPGKGVSKGGRRVTLMFAFWKNIQIRKEVTPGSARPFPTTTNEKAGAPAWATALTNPAIKVKESLGTDQKPIELDAVYETLDGDPWKPKNGMPDYEQVFQGF
jgi:hypothetical protein